MPASRKPAAPAGSLAGPGRRRSALDLAAFMATRYHLNAGLLPAVLELDAIGPGRVEERLAQNVFLAAKGPQQGASGPVVCGRVKDIVGEQDDVVAIVR